MTALFQRDTLSIWSESSGGGIDLAGAGAGVLAAGLVEPAGVVKLDTAGIVPGRRRRRSRLLQLRGSQQPCCDRNARNHPAARCVPRQRPPPFQKHNFNFKGPTRVPRANRHSGRILRAIGLKP